MAGRIINRDGAQYEFPPEATDEQIDAYFTSNTSVTPPAEPLPTYTEEGTRALERGVYRTLGNLSDAVGSAPDMPGNFALPFTQLIQPFEEPIRDVHSGTARRFRAAEQQVEPNTVQDFREGFSSLDNFARYAIGLAGTSAPETALGLAGGIAGAGASAYGAGSRIMAQSYGLMGTYLGSSGVSLPNFYGANIQAQRDAGVPEDEIDKAGAFTAALSQAQLSSAFDTLLAGRLGKLFMPGGVTTKERLKAVMTAPFVGAAVEVPTEIAQEALELYQSNPELLLSMSPDVQEHFLQTAVGAAVVGGILSTGTETGVQLADSLYARARANSTGVDAAGTEESPTLFKTEDGKNFAIKADGRAAQLDSPNLALDDQTVFVTPPEAQILQEHKDAGHPIVARNGKLFPIQIDDEGNLSIRRSASDNPIRGNGEPKKDFVPISISRPTDGSMFSRDYEVRTPVKDIMVEEARASNYRNVPDNLMGFSRDPANTKAFGQTNYPYRQKVAVKFPDGDILNDEIEGMNKQHALERARRNWPTATNIRSIGAPIAVDRTAPLQSAESPRGWSGVEPDPVVRVSPNLGADWAPKETIRNVLKQVAPDASIRFTDDLKFTGKTTTYGSASASSHNLLGQQWENVIDIALRYSGDNMRAGASMNTALHEALHFLDLNGFFTPEEQTTIDEALPQLAEIASQEAESRNYVTPPEWFMGEGARSPREAGTRRAEALAIAGSRYMDNRLSEVQPTSPLGRVLEKIKKFFKSLGRAVRRQTGMSRVEDIFEEVITGNIGRRTAKHKGFSSLSRHPAITKTVQDAAALAGAPNVREFAQWINGTEVVDENGLPLVVMYGAKDISDVSTALTDTSRTQTKNPFGPSLFFSDSPQDATLSFRDYIPDFERIEQEFQQDPDNMANQAAYTRALNIGLSRPNYIVPAYVKAKNLFNFKGTVPDFLITELPQLSNVSRLEHLLDDNTQNELLAAIGGAVKRAGYGGIKFTRRGINSFSLFQAEAINFATNPTDSRLRQSLYDEATQALFSTRGWKPIAEYKPEPEALDGEVTPPGGQTRKASAPPPPPVTPPGKQIPGPAKNPGKTGSLYLGDSADSLSRFLSTARHLAARYAPFANVYAHAQKMKGMRTFIQAEAMRTMENYDLVEDKTNIHAALELNRFKGVPEREFNYDVDGNVTFLNDHGDLQLSKRGDVIRLNDEEFKGYLSYRTTMRGLFNKIKVGVIRATGKQNMPIGWDENGNVQYAEFRIPEDADAAFIREQGRQAQNAANSMDGVFGKAHIKKVKADLLTAADNLKTLATKVASMEHNIDVPYAPFMRFGDTMLFVKDPKTGKTIHMEGVEGVETTIGYKMNKAKVHARRDELRKQYPEADITFKSNIQTEQMARAAVSPEAFDSLMGMLSTDDLESYKNLRNTLQDILKDRGFNAHLNNANLIPGYSVDFDEAAQKYINMISSAISRLHYGSDVYDMVNKMPDDVNDPAVGKLGVRMKEYGAKYADYIVDPEEELAWIRQMSFFATLGFAPDSAILQALSIPQFLLPQLSGFIGVAKGTATVGKAMADAARIMKNYYKFMFKHGKHGIKREVFGKQFVDMSDPAIVGFLLGDTSKLSPAEVRKRRNEVDALLNAYQSGNLKALLTMDALGVTSEARTKTITGRASKFTHAAAEASGHFFNTVETFSRITAFLANYRAMRDNPDMLSHMKELYNVNNKLFEAQVSGGVTDSSIVPSPEGQRLLSSDVSGSEREYIEAAKFMTEDAFGMFGKENTPDYMRRGGGVLKAVGQFQSWVQQMLELEIRLIRTVSGKSNPKRARRIAATQAGLIIGMLFAFGGLFGNFAGQNLKDLYEALYKVAMREDLDVDRVIREFSRDALGSRAIGEMLTKGPISGLINVDLSARASIQDLPMINVATALFTGSGRPGEALGVPGSILIGSAHRFNEETRHGVPAGEAALKNIPLRALANPIQAMYWNMEGVYTTGRNRVLAPPGTGDGEPELSYWDVFSKGIGFTSKNVSQQREIFYTRMREARAMDDRSRIYREQIIDALTKSVNEKRRGNPEGAAEYREFVREIAAEIREYNQTVPVKDRIRIDSPSIQREIANNLIPRLRAFREAPRQRRTAVDEVEDLYYQRGQDE